MSLPAAASASDSTTAAGARHDADEPTVMSGLAPLFADPAELDPHRFGRSHQVFAASSLARDLLTSAIADDWLDCSLLRNPYFSVLFRDEVLPLQQVSVLRFLEGQAHAGFVDGAKVRAWLARGATIAIGGVEDWHPPAKRLCAALGPAMAARASASVFWTGPGARGLRVHRDDAHVVIVQIAGTKHWSIHDTPATAKDWEPGFVDPASLPAPTELSLSPGQALYLPEGCAHSATAQAEPTIHMTLAFREPPLHDVMALAVKACLADVPSHARASGSAERRRETIASLLHRLADALHRVEVGALNEAAGKRAAGRR